MIAVFTLLIQGRMGGYMSRWTGCIALAMFFCVSAELLGQNSFQDFQKKVDEAMPKGRLIKRFRDEIRGTTPEEKKKAEEQKRLQESSKTPTLANPGGRKSLANRPAEPTAPLPVQSGGSKRNGNPLSANQAPSNRSQDSNQRKADDKPVGFGIVLDQKNDKVFVVAAEKTGNAYREGIRSGDVIEKVGGVPVTSIQEFDDVVGVLKDGDAIEVDYSRRGKSATANVTFGFMDKSVAEVELEEKPNHTTEFSDFAPPIFSSPQAKNEAVRSVLDDEKLSSPVEIPSITGGDQRNLERIIREQQRTIEKLQKEIEILQRNSSRAKTIDPPLGT